MNNGNEKTSSLPIRATALAGLIDYQPGAVVSKTLIDRPGGTLTLFAFDKNQGLSEHTAPFDAMVYVYDGQALVTISGMDYTVNSGDCIIMPANEPHALKAVEAFKMLLGMIRS
ncbi:MAG: cupin domain-containing protein [Dehalococcoidaceae bacterium]|nr:cupin domain-containing protein [Dehalococcoidaceae bacterium]